mgnify:CR=1 FL=1
MQACNRLRIIVAMAMIVLILPFGAVLVAARWAVSRLLVAWDVACGGTVGSLVPIRVAPEHRRRVRRGKSNNDV